MVKGVNVVNTQKLISNKSKCTQKTETKSITNTQPLSVSAQVIQVITWTLGVWISYPQGLEVLSNWNFITLITRALHYLGDQIGCGIKSISLKQKLI